MPGLWVPLAMGMNFLELDVGVRRYLRFCYGVRALRQRYPFSVPSWWRTPARQELVGDEKLATQHYEGTGLDAVFDPGREPAAPVFVAAAREYGLEAVPEGDHWHLEWFTRVV